ncbi:hypothetical protein ACEQ8H_001275 [Pleosporales sp. CAS-2024a]
MTTHPSPFTYSELGPGEIRLLTPADHEEYPAWSLKVARLDDPYLDFDALSYTWGSQNQTYPLICNGHSMRIHHNLHSALQFLARRMGELTHRSIWVDAVCIDQANEDEKHVQIKVMNQIYRRAKHVWVWLGCAAPNIQLHMSQAIDLLPHIVEEATRRKASSYIEGKEEVPLPLRGLVPDVWKAVAFLLGNPWFSRLWIIQEAVLASDIIFMCGAHRINATMLEEAVDSDKFTSWRILDIDDNPVKIPPTRMVGSTVFWIRELVRRRKLTQGFTPGLLLRVTLLMTEYECYLPEDRVFSMLGLISETELGSLGVDFHNYNSISTLYTQFATYLLLNNIPNETGFWWPLFNNSFSFHRMEGLPSWVPDFHHQGTGSKYVCMPATIAEYGRNSKQHCSSGRRTEIRLGAHTGELVLRGKIVDKIVAVHPPGIRHLERTGWKGDAATWLARIAEWHENLAHKVLDRYDDEGVEVDEQATEVPHVPEDVYWRTLLANNFLDESKNAMTIKQCRDFRRTMRLVMQRCKYEIESIQREAAGIDKLPPEIDARCALQSRLNPPFESLVLKIMLLGDRQFFHTAHGRFGFTNKGINPGDLVCVFNSASTPHILRRAAHRKDEAYRVLGDAYVHGLMSAEADDMSLQDENVLLI